MKPQQLEAIRGTLQIRRHLPHEMAEQLFAHAVELRVMLGEVADALEYAAGYKGDYLAQKHGDMELVGEARALLGEAG